MSRKPHLSHNLMMVKEFSPLILLLVDLLWLETRGKRKKEGFFNKNNSFFRRSLARDDDNDFYDSLTDCRSKAAASSYSVSDLV